MNHPIAAPDQRASFERQVRQFQGLVFTIAYGILLNPQESLDIMQETFLQAFIEPRFLEDTFDRKNWLVTVARHRALNLRRSWWGKIRLLAGIPEPRQESHSPELAEFFIRQEALTRLREAMQCLAEEERELLTLRFVARSSYAQIAEALGIKIGTVMSRLARVKERLGDLYGDDDGT